MYEWGLIDLKRLHDDVEYWEQHDDPKQPDYDTRDIETVIGSQPIIDAIPLEWLKKNYGGLQIVRYIMKDWELHDSVVVPYSDELPNIIFETTTKEIPMAWIKAYTRTPISNADFWAITRMVTRWEEGKEIRERHEI